MHVPKTQILRAAMVHGLLQGQPCCRQQRSKGICIGEQGDGTGFGEQGQETGRRLYPGIVVSLKI